MTETNTGPATATSGDSGAVDAASSTGIGRWIADRYGFRGRHPLENMGDIPALYRRYGEVTGEPVDLPVVCYQTVNFLQLSGIAACFFMEPRARGANWIEGLLEYASITRRALEAVAELQGINLDHAQQLPQPVDRPWEASGLQKLLTDIGSLPTSARFESWERDLLRAIPQFLLNYSRYRDWFETETRSELEVVLGRDFATLAQAEAAAMEAVADSDGARDEAWLRALHRRSLRLSMIIAGTEPDSANPLFHRLDPILEG